MAIIDLSKQNSIMHQFVTEIRDIDIQADRMRFRKNLERMGEIFAYEISKKLSYGDLEVETSMGVAECKVIAIQPVLATILRVFIHLLRRTIQSSSRRESLPFSWPRDLP